jgi:hypothetical protein
LLDNILGLGEEIDIRHQQIREVELDTNIFYNIKKAQLDFQSFNRILNRQTSLLLALFLSFRLFQCLDSITRNQSNYVRFQAATQSRGFHTLIFSQLSELRSLLTRNTGKGNKNGLKEPYRS